LAVHGTVARSVPGAHSIISSGYSVLIDAKDTAEIVASTPLPPTQPNVDLAPPSEGRAGVPRTGVPRGGG